MVNNNKQLCGKGCLSFLNWLVVALVSTQSKSGASGTLKAVKESFQIEQAAWQLHQVLQDKTIHQTYKYRLHHNMEVGMDL